MRCTTSTERQHTRTHTHLCVFTTQTNTRTHIYTLVHTDEEEQTRTHTHTHTHTHMTQNNFNRAISPFLSRSERFSDRSEAALFVVRQTQATCRNANTCGASRVCCTWRIWSIWRTWSRETRLSVCAVGRWIQGRIQHSATAGTAGLKW